MIQADPLPLVEEVCAHLQEMLDLDMICPRQSAWCNAVVLVQKKDGSLCFCIDFCHLNAHMTKDSYLLPRIQEALESLFSAGHFSLFSILYGGTGAEAKGKSAVAAPKPSGVAG